MHGVAASSASQFDCRSRPAFLVQPRSGSCQLRRPLALRVGDDAWRDLLKRVRRLRTLHVRVRRREQTGRIRLPEPHVKFVMIEPVRHERIMAFHRSVERVAEQLRPLLDVGRQRYEVFFPPGGYGTCSAAPGFGYSTQPTVEKYPSCTATIGPDTCPGPRATFAVEPSPRLAFILVAFSRSQSRIGVCRSGSTRASTGSIGPSRYRRSLSTPAFFGS